MAKSNSRKKNQSRDRRPSRQRYVVVDPSVQRVQQQARAFQAMTDAVSPATDPAKSTIQPLIGGVPVPTITFVHYADKTYLHLNGKPILFGLSESEMLMALRVAEAIQSAGAVKVDEREMRDLSINS